MLVCKQWQDLLLKNQWVVQQPNMPPKIECWPALYEKPESHEACRKLTCTNDDCVEQGGCVARSNTVEQDWGVEDDGVDASELLEHHEEQRDD